ncbi:hypothetical protein OpiT1DRAFT_05652 [Opitutaceae bacterium TAV1]|nr:hypothetical protein OpiT1DRAFT_05652 [Opitutaceae bacterium TAV1]
MTPCDGEKVSAQRKYESFLYFLYGLREGRAASLDVGHLINPGDIAFAASATAVAGADLEVAGVDYPIRLRSRLKWSVSH